MFRFCCRHSKELMVYKNKCTHFIKFRVCNLGKVYCKIGGSCGFRVQGFGFKVSGWRFQVEGWFALLTVVVRFAYGVVSRKDTKAQRGLVRFAHVGFCHGLHWFYGFNSLCLLMVVRYAHVGFATDCNDFTDLLALLVVCIWHKLHKLAQIKLALLVGLNH